MTGHTHTPAEWAQMGCLAVGIFESFSVFWFLFVDAKPADFDPRPAVRRAVVVVHQAVVDAGHTANRAYATSLRIGRPALQDAVVNAAASLAALLTLLLPAAPKGATR